MLTAVDDLNLKADGIKEKITFVDQGIDVKIDELKDLVSSSSALKKIRDKIKDL